MARALRVIPAKIVIQPRVYVGSNFWKLPADNRIFQPKSSFLLSLSRFLCIFDFYDAIISDLRFCALPNPLAPIRRNGAFTAFLLLTSASTRADIPSRNPFRAEHETIRDIRDTANKPPVLGPDHRPLHNMAATTPMRPVPGAFINTPAPAPDSVRRDLFGAAGSRRGPLGTSPPRQPAMNRFPPAAGGRPASPPPPPGAPGQAVTPQQPAAVENTPPAQRAARFINELLQLDGSFPELDQYCRRT